MTHRERIAYLCKSAYHIAADEDLGMCLAADFEDCQEDESRARGIEAI